MEDVSVSGNVKHIREIFLFYSTKVFRQYVLGTKIGKRDSLISLEHHPLRLMASFSKDSKPAIQAIIILYTFSLVRI